METGPGDWPSDRWRMTAPESYVLQLPRPLSSAEAFKLALRELALRRALRVEQLAEAGLLGRRRRKTVLRTGTQHVSEPALQPLVELHARTRERGGADGVLVEDYAKQARRAFTRSFAGYVNDHVYPSLADRGLMEVEERAFKRRRYVRTAAGDEAAAELEEWLHLGRGHVEAWGRSEPERLLAYVGGAGAAILLMRDLYPEFDRIGKNVLMGGDLAAVPGGDAGAFDDFDGGAFDAFDGIDAGVDAGGGWGGDGGGGGGDGGGGNGGG
jgi:hypothetical protein